MKEYLGDSVYADFDGWHIVLTTSRDTIYLKPEVQAALIKFLDRDRLYTKPQEEAAL